MFCELRLMHSVLAVEVLRYAWVGAERGTSQALFNATVGACIQPNGMLGSTAQRREPMT
jgi:hypothetical protein